MAKNNLKSISQISLAAFILTTSAGLPLVANAASDDSKAFIGGAIGALIAGGIALGNQQQDAPPQQQGGNIDWNDNNAKPVSKNNSSTAPKRIKPVTTAKKSARTEKVAVEEGKQPIKAIASDKKTGPDSSSSKTTSDKSAHAIALIKKCVNNKGTIDEINACHYSFPVVTSPNFSDSIKDAQTVADTRTNPDAKAKFYAMDFRGLRLSDGYAAAPTVCAAQDLSVQMQYDTFYNSRMLSKVKTENDITPEEYITQSEIKCVRNGHIGLEYVSRMRFSILGNLVLFATTIDAQEPPEVVFKRFKDKAPSELWIDDCYGAVDAVQTGVVKISHSCSSTLARQLGQYSNQIHDKSLKIASFSNDYLEAWIIFPNRNKMVDGKVSYQYEIGFASQYLATIDGHALKETLDASKETDVPLTKL